VLCIQDTTELNFNGQEMAGLGPLNYEARRGMYLHPTYAVTPGREPLGVLRKGRTCPDLDARLFFDPDEIRGAHLLTKKKMPAAPPTLNEVVRLIAQVGGFLGRNSDGDPGAKTIWRGRKFMPPQRHCAHCAMGLADLRITTWVPVNQSQNDSSKIDERQIFRLDAS
jgi:hypothetical protein